MNTALRVYKTETNPENDSVIMLHGYGANGRDLAGLAQFPELSKLKLNWYFLEAPLSPPELAMFGGRAWFSLTLSSFNPNMNPEALEKFYSMKSPEFKDSLQLIKDAIWDLELKGKTYVGGFSQGAMMAANCFMSDPKSYEGLITLSGAPLNFKNWKTTSGQKAFVSHGEQDPVLPFKCGTDLSAKLKESGLSVQQNWFKGGHEIPPTVLTKLSQFLSS